MDEYSRGRGRLTGRTAPEALRARSLREANGNRFLITVRKIDGESSVEGRKETPFAFELFQQFARLLHGE